MVVLFQEYVQIAHEDVGWNTHSIERERCMKHRRAHIVQNTIEMVVVFHVFVEMKCMFFCMQDRNIGHVLHDLSPTGQQTYYRSDRKQIFWV